MSSRFGTPLQTAVIQRLRQTIRKYLPYLLHPFPARGRDPQKEKPVTMPFYDKSEEWVHQSALLLQARPATVWNYK
jgi:hypothetical protein